MFQRTFFSRVFVTSVYHLSWTKLKIKRWCWDPYHVQTKEFKELILWTSTTSFPSDFFLRFTWIFFIKKFIFDRPSLFPDEETPNRLFDGVPFKDIPTCNVRVSKNNTIITVCDGKGKPNLIRSCGVEGFKNTRKGTNIAAQATAISIATVRSYF